MRALQAVFKILPGEGRTVFLLVALMLCSMAGSTVGSSSIQALFFARLGVGLLPLLYVVLGLVTILITVGIAVLLSRAAPTRIYGLSPLVLAGILVVARLLLLLDAAWLYPVLWVLASVMVSAQGVFTWGLAGAACDTRQAKRLFPLVNAGGILGAVAGGLATPRLATWLGAGNLVLVWVIAYGLAFLLGRAVIAGAPVSLPSPRAKPARVIDELRDGLQIIRRSALLSWMAVAVTTYFVLVYLLNFPFSAAATAQFAGADALAGFLGVFQAAFTGAAFLSSVFLGNRLFARFGIMNVLLGFAAVCLVGFAALVVSGAFEVLVAFRFVQMALVAGLAITAYQAVFNVVPPRRRDQMRAFVAGGPGQAGIIAAGLVLGIGSQVLRPQDLYLIGLAVAALSTFCTWQAKRAYRAALVEALRTGQPVLFVEDESFGGLQRDVAAVAVVVAGSSDGDAITRRTSVEILGQLAVPEGKAALVRALGDPDGAVRASGLQALARTRAASAVPEITARLRDPDPDVRREAIIALAELDSDRARVAERVRALVSDADVSVRAQAHLALLRAGPDPSAWETVKAMAGSTDPESRAFAIMVIGSVEPQAGHDRLELLVQALGDRDMLVRREAAEALGRVGEEALEPVVRGLSDTALESGALLALAYLPATGAASTIRGYARSQAARALQCIQLWQELGEAASDERRLLGDSLRDESRRRGVSALRAMAALSHATAISLSIEGLNSQDPSQRANALEALDNLGERTVISPLLQVWETPAVPPRSDGALAKALRDADAWIRACAVLAAGGSQDPAERSALAELATSDSDPLVRELATGALCRRDDGHASGGIAGGVAMDSLPAVSLLERVVFLRRVPLFANLAPLEVKQIAAVAGERVYADGEMLARQGDPGDEMYVIVSGEVRVVVNRADGSSEEAVRRGVGEYVGEMAILTQEPRIATLIAAGSVRTLSIDQQAFERILRERPETALAVIRVLCARLNESEARVRQAG